MVFNRGFNYLVISQKHKIFLVCRPITQFLSENIKKKYQVWYQGCVDNDGLGELKKEFEKLEDALKYAEKLCNEYWVEYGIRFINL